MKNDMITSFYDFLEGKNYESKEDSEKTDRREFLKRMGIAGLAVVGLPSILANLNGCAPVHVRGSEPYVPLRSMADIANKKELELEDFLLSKEEMYGLRLSQGIREGIRTNFSNPEFNVSKKHCFGPVIGSPQECAQKMTVVYHSGSYPVDIIKARIVISAEKYNSKKEHGEILEKGIEFLRKQKENPPSFFKKVGIYTNFFHRYPFIGSIGTNAMVPKSSVEEAIDRIETYKSIRKLSHIISLEY